MQRSRFRRSDGYGLALVGLLALLPCSRAQSPLNVGAAFPGGVPRYVPETIGLRGTLNSVGSDTMDVVIFGWIQLFRKFHPDVRVTMEARSSLTACPPLTSRAPDIGPPARHSASGGVVAVVQRVCYR